MKKLYETRSIVHKIDSTVPKWSHVIFRDFSLCEVYLSYRDETDFLAVNDVWHELIPVSKRDEIIVSPTPEELDGTNETQADPRLKFISKKKNKVKRPEEGIWHKKELIRNLLAYGYYDPDNEEFQEKFDERVWIFGDEVYSKNSLETHYRFLLSLPLIDNWMKTKEFRLLPSDDTKQTYRRSLRIFFQYLADEQLDVNHYTVDDIVDFFDQLKIDKLSTYYINKLYYAMLHFIRYANPELEHDFIGFVRVATPPSLLEIAPKSVDKNTLMTLRKYLEDNIMNAETITRRYEAVRNKCIIDIMFETGVRLSEVTNLDMDSITDDVVAIYGKGNKVRHIPLNSIVKRSLVAYLDAREQYIREVNKKVTVLDEVTPVKVRGIPRAPVRPLFYSHQRRRLSSRSIARIFEKIEGLHPHLSRHTFITSMVRNEDLSLTSSLSGHSSLNMVARYSKPSQAELLLALERKASRDE